MAVRQRKRINLKKTLFLLPNLLTMSSIFCGFDSIRISASAHSEKDFHAAALLLIFAMFFDTMDGRVARMTKTQSAFGLQIDSLADVVSFGVAPSLLVYQWSLHSLGTIGVLGAFLFTACGAIRLARFNVLSTDSSGAPAKPSKFIVGLPIPGAAGILISLVVANYAAGTNLGGPSWAWLMFGVTLILSLLQVSNCRFRSFKDLKLNGRTAFMLLFVVGSSFVIASQTKPAFVLVWLLGCYVTLGVFESILHLFQQVRAFVRRDSLPPQLFSLG
jgi:CDP-diacylglycerol---serine O-phosphatidyltransferase